MYYSTFLLHKSSTKWKLHLELISDENVFCDIRDHFSLEPPKEYSWIYGGLKRVYSCPDGQKYFTMLTTTVDHYWQELGNRVPDIFNDGMTHKYNQTPRGGFYRMNEARDMWHIFGLHLNRFWNEYSGETLFFSLNLDLCWILEKIGSLVCWVH